MTPGRGLLNCILFLSCVFILQFQNASAGDIPKISTILAHSVCTENTEFKRTGVLQKPIKRKSDFDLSSIKCGWFPLRPCHTSSFYSSSSCVNFYPCNQNEPKNAQGRGLGSNRPSNDGQNPAFILPGLGLKDLSEDSNNRPSFARKQPRDRGRNGGTMPKTLPLTVTPQHYDIFLRPVIIEGVKWPKLSAPGTVAILLDVNEPTSNISLHRAQNLEIISVKLIKKSDNTEVPIAAQSYDDSEEIQTFELTSQLTSVGKGQYELLLVFNATISKAAEGMHAVQYLDHDGNSKELVMTQMQYDWARNAFPAFDEPLYKATFTISIARTADFNVMSNSIKAKTVEDPENSGWFIDHFEKTLKMSTYIVAFLISDFTCITADPEIYPGKPVQICGDPKRLAAGFHDFTLNTTAHGMKLLETTFKYPYEHSQVVGVAAPVFNGGMENWGLIMYDQKLIQYKKRETLEFNRLDSVKLVLHELIHNWVGNLVTCKSWNDTWLNEGLTTYLQGWLAPQLNLELRQNYFLDETQRVLREDIGLTKTVSGPTAGNDDLIYFKGAAILRMVEGFMGKELLLEAIVEYLKRFAYESVEQDDFFGVLNEFAVREGRIKPEHTMKRILEPWVFQTGHPLIRVEQVSPDSTGSSVSGTRSIKVSQEPYLEKEASRNSNPALWDIPIFISSHKNPTIGNRAPDLWLSSATMETMVDDGGPESWYILNAEAFGVYHVWYSDELFDLILAQLSKEPKIITGASKSALIFDYFLLYEQGHVTLEKALSLTKYLTHELDEDAWTTVFKYFPFASRFLLLANPDFKAYWNPRIEKLLDIYGVEDLGEIGSKVILKSSLLQWSNSLISPVFTSKASSIVEKWKASGQPISPVRPDYWGPIYCGAVADKHGSQFDFFLQVFTKTDPSKLLTKEVFSILDALTCTQNPETIQTLLEFTLNGKITEEAHITRFFQTIALNTAARIPLLQFLKERFADLLKLKRGVGFINGAISSIAGACYSEVEQDQLLAIIAEHPDEIFVEGTVKNEIERHLDWLSTKGNLVLKWFSENK